MISARRVGVNRLKKGLDAVTGEEVTEDSETDETTGSYRSSSFDTASSGYVAPPGGGGGGWFSGLLASTDTDSAPTAGDLSTTPPAASGNNRTTRRDLRSRSWLGLLTCKYRLPYNLYCVGGDVKHCSISISVCAVELYRTHHVANNETAIFQRHNISSFGKAKIEKLKKSF